MGNIICGGKIGSEQHLQNHLALVAPGLSTCGVRSHFTKAKGFDERTIYIKTLLVRGKVTVHLTSVLGVTSVSSSIISSLLQLEHTVFFWTSLLHRLPLLLATDLNKLMFTLDVIVIVKKYHIIPRKDKSTRLSSVALDSIYF